MVGRPGAAPRPARSPRPGLLEAESRFPEAAVDLAETVESLLPVGLPGAGDSWIADSATHTQIYKLWSEFAMNEIEAIGGMTMNERLFSFRLFAQFDSASTQERRSDICAKLLASPDLSSNGRLSTGFV